MKQIDFYSTYLHDYDSYEQSHGKRLDFLVEDLKLNELDGFIGEFGCGLGFIFNRLKPELQKKYVGYDYTDLKNFSFEYHKVDLNNFVIEEKDKKKFDYIFCFETVEHLENIYNCLIQIKNSLKKDGLLFLSIPNIDCTHNTIYPGLLYPVQNFIQFLGQMSFEIKDYRIHNKCFKQEVFTLINKDWDFSKMLFYKNEEKFRNIPPHISVNL